MDQEGQESKGLRPPKLVRYSVNSSNPAGIPNVGVSKESMNNSDPLTIGLILENIFSNLNGEDLESCKKVNQCWKSVIGQLHARHYEVIFTTKATFNFLRVVGKQSHVSIKKIYWSSKYSPWKKYTVSEALEILGKKSSKERKFAIKLELSSCIAGYDADTFRNFVSKVGHLVHTFSPGAGYKTLGTFCSSLVHFPNLHHLVIGSANFDDDENGRPLDPSFKKPEGVLNKLKKISFGSRSKLHRVESVEFFLELAPMLEEIHEFPVLLVNALISKEMANKGCMIKSISYPSVWMSGNPREEDLQNDDDFQLAFSKFALLAPKLRSFSFCMGVFDYRDNSQSANGIYSYRQAFHPYARHILESSHQSLEVLTICLPGNFDFNSVAKMTSLRKIELINGKSFPWDKIPLNLRLQIKEIILDFWEKVDSNEIRALGNYFGSLKCLEFSYDLDQLDPIFPLIAEFWPELEVISIKLLGNWTSPLTFDSFFTGIPDNVLTQLRDPVGRDEFTEDEMARIYASSALRKLTKLKKLELLHFSFFDVKTEVLNNKFHTITSLSKEFGFDFMSPTFQLVIRGLSDDILDSISDVKEALSDVAIFEVSPY